MGTGFSGDRFGTLPEGSRQRCDRGDDATGQPAVRYARRVLHGRYAARHSRLGAIKVLSEAHSGATEFRARFIREAELAARIDHPNVVAVHDRGLVDGALWIAMQYIAVIHHHGVGRARSQRNSCSSCAASEIRVGSVSAVPISCAPIGSPASVKPAGTFTLGQPRTFHGQV